jgi:N-acyl-D-amino-acid deacylase
MVIAATLAALGVAVPLPLPAAAFEPVRPAVEKGLRRIENGATAFLERRSCFSCHHQALAIKALAAGARRGIHVDADRLRAQIGRTLGEFQPIQAQLRSGEGLIGLGTTAGYALSALASAGHAPDDVTGALVEYLLVRQQGDGTWPARSQRPPTAGSPLTNSAAVLAGMRTYRDAFDNERRRRVDDAIARSREWLLRSRPVDTEEDTARLRALVLAAAPAAVIDAARGQLAVGQRADGSWAQLPDREGDAYATATALLALQAAGLDAGHDVYTRGVRYLLRTQREDGAWVVQTRSRPVQPFFDNGDPGGPSQFISFAATAWSVLALLEALPPR